MRVIAVQGFDTQPTMLEVPTPQPGSGEVLVKVHDSSVNGFDVAVARGYVRGMMEYQFPVVIGKDFSGTISAVGEGVSRFQVGDKVFGVVMRQVLHDGAFGEYVVSPESFAITRMPDGLDFQKAGALGLAGTAALQALEALALQPGDTVLVSGASGGVGAFAVQLAAARGATVIATAKPGEEADFVRDLGAHEAVDYASGLKASVRAIRPQGVDAALHLAGSAADLVALLVPGGRIASAIGFTQEQAEEQDVTVTAVMAMPDPATLDRLADEVVAGRLRVPIQHSYPLEQAPQALADFASGKTGKIAIAVTG